mgnify:CR=1 FL=1
MRLKIKRIQYICKLNPPNNEKKIYLIGLIIAFFSLNVFSQSTPIKANADQLKKTAQIWGFLKYYHPSVANGSYDWDQQLLKVIDQLDSSFSKLETETLFSQWINSLGTIPECPSCSKIQNWHYQITTLIFLGSSYLVAN